MDWFYSPIAGGDDTVRHDRLHQIVIGAPHRLIHSIRGVHNGIIIRCLAAISHHYGRHCGDPICGVVLNHN